MYNNNLRALRHKSALRLQNFPAGTCSSWVAVALFSGFFTKHWLTKSWKDGDHRSGFLKVGGGLVGIMKMAWKRREK